MTEIKDLMVERYWYVVTVYKDGRVSFGDCRHWPSPEDESIFTGDKSVAGYTLIRDKGRQGP